MLRAHWDMTCDYLNYALFLFFSEDTSAEAYHTIRVLNSKIKSLKITPAYRKFLWENTACVQQFLYKQEQLGVDEIIDKYIDCLAHHKAREKMERVDD